jgi:hypothetical protein
VLDYSWTAENDNCGSDHFTIRIKKTPNWTPRECKKKLSRLHNKHMKWVSFMESMKRKTGRLGEESKWNRRNSSVERYDTLIEAMKELMEECSPSKRRD